MVGRGGLYGLRDFDRRAVGFDRVVAGDAGLGPQPRGEDHRSRSASRARRFSPAFTLVPVATLFVLLPLIYRWIDRAEEQSTYADPERLRAEDQRKVAVEKRGTLGAALDNAWPY